MSKATPRQWKQAEGSKEVILDERYRMIGEIITEANAELIVRAVNCHEELVKLLEESHERFLLNDRPTEEQKDLEVRINKALRRAKGE